MTIADALLCVVAAFLIYDVMRLYARCAALASRCDQLLIAVGVLRQHLRAQPGPDDPGGGETVGSNEVPENVGAKILPFRRKP